ncbi:unnamed protein product [Larinioides sclopetarius]|uniref:Ycf1 n=1 Tax=Larinioides sclopetarius TaxID=280406 RepID=A0AAV2BH20_9ARAC
MEKIRWKRRERIAENHNSSFSYDRDAFIRKEKSTYIKKFI